MDVDKPLSVAFLIALMVGGFILTANMHFGLAQTGTNVSGIINTNTIWTKTGNPYTLTGPTAVMHGITLEIKPGVVINLNGSYIQVNGTLRAQGSVTDNIKFNSGGIHFKVNSNGWNTQTSSGSLFEYTILNQTFINSVNSLKISQCNIISAAVAVGPTSEISNNILRGFDFGYKTTTIPYALTTGASSTIYNNEITCNQAYSRENNWAVAKYTYYAVNAGSSSTISNNTIIGDVSGESLTVIDNIIKGGISGHSNVILNNMVTGDISGDSITVTGNTIVGGTPIHSWMGQIIEYNSAILSIEGASVITDNTISSPYGGYGITAASNANIKGNTILASLRVAGDCLIENNIVANSNGIDIGYSLYMGAYYPGGNLLIKSNLIINNSKGIIGGSGQGTITIEKNLINNNTIGIDARSVVTIRNNIITNSSNAISIMSSSVIEGNLIANSSGDAIKCLSSETTPVTIQNNTIDTSNIAIRLTQFSAMINYNNIQNCLQKSIYLEGISSSANAINNWWGTTDTQAINQTIHDFKDDFNLDDVDFVPFLLEPNPHAMPHLTVSLPIPTPSPTLTIAPNPISSQLSVAPTESANSPQSSIVTTGPTQSSPPTMTPTVSANQTNTQVEPQSELYPMIGALAVVIAVLAVVVVMLFRKVTRLQKTKS